MIKLALLGTGKMGQNHLKNIVNIADFELSFIYDYDLGLARRLGAEFEVRVSDDLSRDLEGVDAVIIATPTSTHKEYFELVSTYVKNIFVEKPLGADLAECEHLAELAKERDLRVQVGFIERFNPAFVALKDELKDISANDVFSMEFCRTSLASARISDTDVISDLMIHDLDLTLSLNGAGQCLAAVGVRGKSGAYDMARAMIKHENGVVSTICASRITHKNERSIKISTKDKFFKADLLNKSLHVFENAQIAKSEQSSANALASELESFAGLCANQRVMAANEISALNAAGLIEQIKAMIK